MTHLAILDHDNHELFLESVDDDIILEKYDGSEETYIKDRYGFADGDNFSWEWITPKVGHFGEIGAIKLIENGD